MANDANVWSQSGTSGSSTVTSVRTESPVLVTVISNDAVPPVVTIGVDVVLAIVTAARTMSRLWVSVAGVTTSPSVSVPVAVAVLTSGSASLLSTV